MMSLGDVIERLDGLREDSESGARRKGASPEWRKDAEALAAAVSLLREYQATAQRTDCPSEIVWVMPEQARYLRRMISEAQSFVKYVKSEVKEMKGRLDLCEAAAEAVSALTRAEILMREVDKHGRGEN